MKENEFKKIFINVKNIINNKKDSITVKLTLGISFIVFICTFTIGLIFLSQYREMSLKQVEKDLLKNAEQLSNLGNTILSGNNMPNDNFFRMLRRITTADFWVVDNKGNVVASTININNIDRSINELNEKFVTEIKPHENKLTYDYSNILNEKTLTLITPIYAGNYLKGTIMIHNNLKQIYDSNAHLTGLIVISLLISLGLSVGLGIYYSKHFTKPIINLIDVTKKISQRDYSAKTNIKRNDEIGTLALTIDQMTDEIDKNIKEISQLEKRAKDLVANVSHEFKTPLTLIRGYVENLNDNITEPNRVIYQKILTNTFVLEKIVTELLDLSKLQSGNVILNIEELELKQLVNDVIDDMQTMSSKKNIKLNLIDKFNDNQIINADYIKIRQLITIFIDNAIKYSKDDSNVDIIISKQKLTILDKGIGIEKTKLEQIFERYHQIENNQKGYGLGLCIAKYIADAHGYKIKIKSSKDNGTIIDIYFK